MYTLEGVSSIAIFITALKSLNKTESPIFYLLCVLYFLRQLLRFLIYFTTAGMSAVWRP